MVTKTHPCIICGYPLAGHIKRTGEGTLCDGAIRNPRVQQSTDIGGPEEQIEVHSEGHKMHVRVRHLGTDECEDRGGAIRDGPHLRRHGLYRLLCRVDDTLLFALV